MFYSRLVAIWFLFAAMILVSCDSKTALNSSDEKKLDTLWNEDVQNSFFGISFGASQGEAKESLKRNRLLVQEINDNCIQCFPVMSDQISYGGISWEYFFAHFCNGKLYMVVFQSAFSEKEEAIEQYTYARKQMSAKYKVMDVPLRDSTEIARSGIYSKTSRKAGIVCDAGYSDNHVFYYYTELVYVDKEYDKTTEQL